jgi:hypothetical protein
MFVYKYISQKPEVKWKLQIGSKDGYCAISDIFVTETGIYVWVEDGFHDYLYAVNTDGSIRWMFDLTDFFDQCIKVDLKPIGSNNNGLYVICEYFDKNIQKNLGIVAVDAFSSSVFWDISLSDVLGDGKYSIANVIGVNFRTGSLYVLDSLRKKVVEISSSTGEIVKTVFEVSKKYDSIISGALGPDGTIYLLVLEGLAEFPYVSDIALYSINPNSSVNWKVSFIRTGIIEDNDKLLWRVHWRDIIYDNLIVLGSMEKYSICIYETELSDSVYLSILCFAPDGEFKWKRHLVEDSPQYCFYDKNGNLYLESWYGSELVIVRGYDGEEIASIKIPKKVSNEFGRIFGVTKNTVYSYCMENLYEKICAFKMKKIEEGFYDLEIKWEFKAKSKWMSLLAKTNESGTTYVAFPYKYEGSFFVPKGSCFLYAIAE